MSYLSIRSSIVILLGLFLISACVWFEPIQVPRIITVVVTATLKPTSTATNTPLPTTPPTPTATSTPTAMPLNISGEPLLPVRKAPISQNGAPCGFVDIFDFPLDPPDGDKASGGQDFSVFRSRFEKYHTGEDWSYRSGTSLGEPVYSIGHGMATYAQPLGWGADQGVVILQHTFPDGRKVLSFYGHLEPSSVDMQPGNCVQRGEVIGRIGKPRTRPHLHFEIRLHMPNGPGPGYWSTDPTQAGWFPPSQYIWETRIKAQAVVQWTRTYGSLFRRGLGKMPGDTFVLQDGQELMGIDLDDGDLRWSATISDTAITQYMVQSGDTIYVANQFGTISAYQLPEDMGVAPHNPALTQMWDIEHAVIGIPKMMPLPGGGIAIYIQQQLMGFSNSGELLWREDPFSTPVGWILTEESLVLSAKGEIEGVWSIDSSNVQPLANGVSGKPFGYENNLYLYTQHGLYQLDHNASTARMIYRLPEDRSQSGDAALLPDGRILIAHEDRDDRRMLIIDNEGNIQWERSYAQAIKGQPRLFVTKNMDLQSGIYLLLEQSSPSTSDVGIYSIDIEADEMVRVFSGGSRYPLPGETWGFPLGEERILLSIGGGSLIALDLRTALGN